MVIREARAEDTPAMARVMVDTYRAAHDGQIPEAAMKQRHEKWNYEISARGWRRALREHARNTNDGECFYVALDETGELVGIATGCPAVGEAAPRAGEVGVLYVQQDRQRQGIGRKLVQAVSAHLAQQGTTTLRIACLKTNHPACCFYEAIGGRVIGEREVEEYGFRLPEVVYGWADIRSLIPTPSLAE